MIFKVDEKIEWKWLGQKISGSVVEVHAEKITRTIKNKKITRNGSKENPAYVVRSEAGNLALKLGSELSKASSVKSVSKKKPTIFSD